MMKIFGTRQTGFYVALIFALALSIRLFNIFGMGLFHWDSGYYVGTALWLIGHGGMPYPWEPPVYSAFVSLGFLILGIHDWVAVLVSALFGALTVILAYLIGKELFDLKTGLVAALFLAISQIHIIYSRMALTDSAFTFFFVMSLLLFIYSIKRQKIRLYAIYGIALGITQNVKYNGFMAFIIPVIFLAAYYAYVKYAGKRVKLDFFLAFKGMVIAFLIMVLMHVPWIFALGVGDYAKEAGSLSMESVFSQLASGNLISIFSRGINLYMSLFLENKAGLLFVPSELLFYPYLILFWTSPALILCFILSFTGRMKKEMAFLLIWFAFFFAFFSAGYKAGRVILPAIPAFSLISAVGAIRLANILKRNFIRKINGGQALGLIIIMVCLASVPSVLNAVSYAHDGYRQAGTFLKENVDKGQYIFTTGGPQIRFYYPDGAWWKFCENVSSNEISYFVTDYIQYRYSENYMQYIGEIKNSSELVASFYNHVVVIESPEDTFKNRLNDDFYKIEIYKIGDDSKKYLSFLDEYKKVACTEL